MLFMNVMTDRLLPGFIKYRLTCWEIVFIKAIKQQYRFVVLIIVIHSDRPE